MEIIRDGKQVKECYYLLNFRYTEDNLSGYRFPCDSEGNVLTDKLEPEGIVTYNQCVSGKIKVMPPFVSKEVHTWYSPMIIRCSCGAPVTLNSSFENTCRFCGNSYNGSGQAVYRYNPREDY